MKTLRDLFIEARERSKLSQAKVADLVGCSEMTIRRLENGTTKRLDEEWTLRAILAMDRVSAEQ